MTEEQIRSALAALQAASDSTFGVVVEIDAFGRDINSLSLRAKGILYQVRQDYPYLKKLQVRVSPDRPDHELWLLKRDEDEDSELAPKPAPTPRPKPRAEDW